MVSKLEILNVPIFLLFLQHSVIVSNASAIIIISKIILQKSFCNVSDELACNNRAIFVISSNSIVTVTLKR